MFASFNRPDWRGGAVNMGDAMPCPIRIACAISALALIGGNAIAKKSEPVPPPPMPTGYDDPGPKPENVLPAILANLRRTLTDPYSMRDLVICEPKATKPLFNSYGAGEWMRSRWMVNFSLNAKNRMGGYAGRTGFLASYTDGKLTSVSDSGGYSDINARMVESTSSCPHVPDAEIQRVLIQ